MATKIELNPDQETKFEQFWKEYPRRNGVKQGKPMAKKAWSKINPDDELFAKIMTALKFLKTTSDWIKEKCKYAPMASTFLNQSRWEIEIELDTKGGYPSKAESGSKGQTVAACTTGHPTNPETVPLSGSLRKQYLEYAKIKGE